MDKQYMLEMSHFFWYCLMYLHRQVLVLMRGNHRGRIGARDGGRAAQLCFMAAVAAMTFALGFTLRPLLWRLPSTSATKDDFAMKRTFVTTTHFMDEARTAQQAPVAGILGDIQKAAADVEDDASNCTSKIRKHYTDYFEFSQRGDAFRKSFGTLRIAAFSRLWVPPIHGTGGMQFHALHLYSQLAARGHFVHVFVTGPPHGHLKKLYFKVNQETLHVEEETDIDKAALVVEQVPSDKNGEYSEMWYEKCLARFIEVNRTVGGFHVAHSESWAGVPNVYQIGLQMVVTWHGSMLDWFRNEMNLIVHNFRMKRKMTSASTASRMSALGSSVAFETYMLLSVPHHIVISDSAAKDLKEMNLVDPDAIHLIYNGVNPQNFKPADDKAAAREAFLKEHRVDPKDFIVGCGGRLDGIKGHHQLSQAMRKVMQRHKNVTLLVAGSGGESARYESMIRDGLGKVVMLGMLPQQKLALFYQSLDIFVDPFYQHHGLNTVMLEATLSGVPIVATRLASAETTAPCSAFGRTFALGKVNELADQIEYLLWHEQERLQIGANVRDRATHLFSSSIMAGAYESLLYSVVANPKPLEPLTGKVVCRHTYPAMCYREPSA